MRQLVTVLRRVRPWHGPLPPEHAWPAPATGAVEVRRRAAAATGSPGVADAVTAAWSRLPPEGRAAVLEPARHLAAEGRQVDGTTCGSAVLTMLAATGDPSLAYWLLTGRLAGHRPPELQTAPARALVALAAASPARRFAAVQRLLKRRSTAGALLGLPWPGAFGTPPWGAARVARFPGVRYRHRLLDDTQPVDLVAALAVVEAAARAGIPVPLYSGGDTTQGWRAAVPRHVVLVHGADDAGLRVFEPGAGRSVVANARALTSGDPQPALGGWAHPVWVLLPEPG